jgi:SH3-like domain-containing protein
VKSWMRVLVVVLVTLWAASAAFGQSGSMRSVTVRETQLRATPSFLGKIVAVLAYADRVELLETQRDWARVRLADGKTQGWVHASALTEKRVVLQAGSENVRQSASSSEVALAGKGFNAEVEARYREETGLDYTWVDRMEGFEVSPEQIVAFLQAGALEPAEGGLR